MSINGVGGSVTPVSAEVPATAVVSADQVIQASQSTLKTLYGSPGTAEGLANTLDRMKQLLQPAQVHVKAAHPELQ